MGLFALVILSVVALLIALAGLWIVDGRMLPGAFGAQRLALDAGLAAAGAFPWLLLAPLLDRWLPVLGPLYAPVAVLGAVAVFLATLVPRSMGAAPRRVLLFGLIWSTVVFVPAAVVAFGIALDHGGSLAANVAPGAAALAVLIAGGDRSGALPARSLPLGIAGVAAVALGWIGWLVGSELAIDAATPGIVAAGLLGAAGGVVGWLVVQRILHQSTTLSAVAAGAISGLMAMTAGAPLFTPLSAGITGIVAGGAAALLYLRRLRATARPQWSLPGTHLLAAGLGVVVIGVAGTGVGYAFTGQPNLAVNQLLLVLLVAAGSMLLSWVLWLVLRPKARTGR